MAMAETSFNNVILAMSSTFIPDKLLPIILERAELLRSFRLTGRKAYSDQRPNIFPDDAVHHDQWFWVADNR